MRCSSLERTAIAAARQFGSDRRDTGLAADGLNPALMTRSGQ
jgi:hypothetical protein